VLGVHGDFVFILFHHYLRQNLLHHFAVDISQAEVAAGVAVGELLVVDAEDVEDGGVEVVHMDFVFLGEVAEVVGGSVAIAGFDASSGEPDGEAGGVVVTAIFPLGYGCTAKLGSPDDEGVVHQAALLEVGEESGNGLVGGQSVFGVTFDEATVLVPDIGSAGLNVADSSFTETTCQEAAMAEFGGLLSVQAVEFPGGFGFVGNVDYAWSDALHLEGHLVALDYAIDIGILSLLEVFLVNAVEHLQLQYLVLLGDFWVLQIFDGRIRSFAGRVTKGCRLMMCREEGGTVVPCPAMTCRWSYADEGGKVAVF